MNCRVDPSDTYHQILDNKTNHKIDIEIHRLKVVENVVINPNSKLEIISGGMMDGFNPFKHNTDSILVYIDSIYCNTYYECYLFMNDSTSFSKCIKDTFNLLNREIYTYEKLGKYEWKETYIIDERFCTNCK